MNKFLCNLVCTSCHWS